MPPAFCAEAHSMSPGTTCGHEGGHSAVGRYAKPGRLRFVLVCDACGAERGHVDTLSYRPAPRPFATHPAELIALELGIDAHTAARIRLAALVCDISLSNLPRELLEKPGPLDADEWAAVHTHPQSSAAMLAGDGFADVRPWILAHHERADGQGYPAAIRTEWSPLEARALAVGHAWEAMLADRPYRSALTLAEAALELRRGAGTQFDAEVVGAALHVLLPAPAKRVAA